MVDAFNVGQKVVCVNSDDANGLVVVGGIYTIEKIYSMIAGTYYVLVEVNRKDVAFLHNMFKPYFESRLVRKTIRHKKTVKANG